MLATESASTRGKRAKKLSLRDEPAQRLRDFGTPPKHHLHAGERKRHVPAAETPQKIKIRAWTKDFTK